VDANTLVFISQFDGGSLVIDAGAVVMLGGDSSSFGDEVGLASSAALDSGSPAASTDLAAAGPGPVPEPGTLTLLALGAAAILRRARRRGGHHVR